MKKIISILIVLLFLAVGCGKDNIAINNEGENTQDTDGNDANGENGDILNGDAKEPAGDNAEEDKNEDDTTKVEEIPFNLQIELPEGTTVGEYISGATVEGTTGWLLENPDYIGMKMYADAQDQLLWTQTACGWIEEHTNDGQIMPDGTPVYTSKYCTKQENGYWIESGYFCEVSVRIFSEARVNGRNIPEEYQDLRYWCIIYKENAQEYTWIFLDKNFYSEEQAKIVADSLPITKHKWVKELVGGWKLYVEQLDEYTIEYSDESNGIQKLIDNETGQIVEISNFLLPLSVYNYTDVNQAQYLREWNIWYEFDGELVEYIDEKAGCSIYHLFSVDMEGNYTDEWGYLAIFGNADSSTVYSVNFKGYELSEVYRILEAIHFDFDKE